MNKLRDRIIVQTDGQMKTGRDVVIAALLGAEEFGFSTGAARGHGLHHDAGLPPQHLPGRHRHPGPAARGPSSPGKPEFVENFFRFIARGGARAHGAARLPHHGRDDRPRRPARRARRRSTTGRRAGLDFSAILYRPPVGPEVAVRKVVEQDHGLEQSLDMTTLLPLCRPRSSGASRWTSGCPSGTSTARWARSWARRSPRATAPEGLPDDTIRIHFTGSAGQSFGAFLPRGITLTLEGDANDYVGKGLSGGKLIVYPAAGGDLRGRGEHPRSATWCSTARPAARPTSAGVAGERFAVRNSGALAVVEGVGDHGCEYMTGGRVVVHRRHRPELRRRHVGRHRLRARRGRRLQARAATSGMVDLEPLVDAEDVELVKDLLARHIRYTQSPVAARLLVDWERSRAAFVKVMPQDYKRVLAGASRRRRRPACRWTRP